jgi:hypothetical protein
VLVGTSLLDYSASLRAPSSAYFFDGGGGGGFGCVRGIPS